MNFQDLENGGAQSFSSSSSSSQNPSQAVASGIFQINTAVNGFRRLVDAVGTIKDTPEHRQKLHSARQRIGQLVKETSSKLKALSDSDHSRGVNPNKTIEDAKIARDFQATLQEYQKLQQLAAERESAYTPSSSSMSSLPTSYGANEQSRLDVNPESRPFLDAQKRQEVLMLGNEVAYNEAIIDERDQGIRDVQYEIAQSNEIFRDLAVLVHNQGTVVDDIASHVDSTAAVTSNAKTHLYRAHKSVKSRSSWCWWMLLIFVLVLVIGLLYFIL